MKYWLSLMLLSGLVSAPVFAQDLSEDAASREPSEYLYEQRIAIDTIHDRELVYFVDRPASGEKVPLLLVIDGSRCVGQLRPSIRDMYRPGPDRPARYARVMVEKPGVEHSKDVPDDCTEEFLKHYSMDNRVTDHLRVLQHLRKHGADWWNGEVLIWGWSDGGDIAVQLTAYYPGVTRAVLGAMGGGFTMAEHFEDFWVCPEERLGEEREECLTDLRRQFKESLTIRHGRRPGRDRTTAGKSGRRGFTPVIPRC